MHIETTAVVDRNNNLMLSDISVLNQFKIGKKIRIIMEDIETIPKNKDKESDKKNQLDFLSSFADDSDIITQDGLIIREDAYNGR